MSGYSLMSVLWAGFWPPGYAALYHLALSRRFRPGPMGPVAWPWFCAAAPLPVIYAAFQWWPPAAVAAVNVAIAVAIWWWRRRKDRKRSLAALGAKSRARLAAMVRSMREKARPRQVLRPVPQGSPA